MSRKLEQKQAEDLADKIEALLPDSANVVFDALAMVCRSCEHCGPFTAQKLHDIADNISDLNQEG
jgi:hypothetical protein